MARVMNCGCSSLDTAWYCSTARTTLSYFDPRLPPPSSRAAFTFSFGGMSNHGESLIEPSFRIERLDDQPCLAGRLAIRLRRLENSIIDGAYVAVLPGIAEGVIRRLGWRRQADEAHESR